jgi:hypothetical protein
MSEGIFDFGFAICHFAIERAITRRKDAEPP